MKKKYLSLISGGLSVLAAALLLTGTILCLFQIRTVVTTIQDVTDDLSGIKLVQYAGLSYLFAVLGICLTLMLALYRASLAYYYFRIFRGDEAFYRARRGGIVGFSLLATVASAACVVLWNLKSDALPAFLPVAAKFAAVLYGILAVLPIVELIIGSILSTVGKPAPATELPPTKEDISASLEAEAEASVPAGNGEKINDCRKDDEKSPGAEEKTEGEGGTGA